ncbi:diacylglycerol/lipid kinase family protein [Lunatimonas salinarum]|uniref:diacylglycerol/lipid kinase family protein n=1 Tax=Lunatimonas salinarum TaxID=1774590 RepID=UPI001ADFB123|nr:diacylglycerol kinase family protein [Lunatimonas salinarum]
MQKPVFVFVNPYCHGGAGWKRWQAIRNEVGKRLPGAAEIITESVSEMANRAGEILATIHQGTFVSAGGDGSMHQLANVLLRSGRASDIGLGAVGLGSSNDFLKPFQACIGKVPVRINVVKDTLQDVGEVSYQDSFRTPQQKYFLINASIGVTAEGNQRFNHPGFFIKWLKKRSTDAAIPLTALSTILTHRNRRLRIRYNDIDSDMQVSNIHLLRSRFVSGNLRYPQGPQSEAGLLGLHICRSMSKWQLIQTLIQLGQGNFEPSENRLSTFTDRLEILCSEPLVFECDGETAEGSMLKFSVKNQAIKLLGSD